jgi:acetyltransferase-like isoleucine patch superfamily enzyme
VKPVLVPTTDVNSETARLVAWHAEDRSAVAAGDAIAEVETSKAILDVPAPDSGFVLHEVREGGELRLDSPVARIFADLAALEAYAEAAAQRQAEAASSGPRATAPARRRAEELGVDLALLAGDRLITVEMVEAASGGPRIAEADLPDPLPGVEGRARIALIGAGLGATQVMDILEAAESGSAVAIADDDPAQWASEVLGVPVVGGFERLVALFEQDAFDAAIVAVGTSVKARARLREACAAAGIPLANAIDPTVRIAAGVELGSGNIICAFCHFGAGTVVGDNNFFSAYNSFDHHSRIGSDNATGPSCVTSGLVTIGDRVRFGMGIDVEPHVEIGDDVLIASGAVITASVPTRHVVKRRIVTTSVVPGR